jgi:hypothetical protein
MPVFSPILSGGHTYNNMMTKIQIVTLFLLRFTGASANEEEEAALRVLCAASPHPHNLTSTLGSSWLGDPSYTGLFGSLLRSFFQ